MRAGGGWIFKFVPFFIAGVFILVVCLWIGVAVLGVKVVDALGECIPALTSKNVDGEHQYSVGCKK